MELVTKVNQQCDCGPFVLQAGFHEDDHKVHV